MEYTVLLAEDQKALRDVVRDYFAAHNVRCDLARNGEEALELLREFDYDAVLLDVMMPQLDGFSVCRRIREHSRVPILFLTALSGESDTLYGYELGADDYVAKPFSLAVLLARTTALIRRSRGTQGDGLLRCGAISADPSTRAAAVDSVPVRLSPREFDLLLCLLRNRGQALSRSQLLDKVWGLDFEGDERSVDVQVKNLRAALGRAGGQIQTVFKVGYKLTE